jgi:hypothetical protein
VEDASQAGALQRATVSGITTSANLLPGFADNFNRPNADEVGNGWEPRKYGGNYSSWRLSNGMMLAANVLNTYFQVTELHAVQINKTDDYTVTFTFYYGEWAQAQYFYFLLNPSVVSGSAAYNHSVAIGLLTQSNELTIKTSNNPGSFNTYASIPYTWGSGDAPNTYHKIKIVKRGKHIKVKAWPISQSEPDNYTLAWEFDSAVNTAPTNYIGFVAYTDGSSTGIFGIDDFVFRNNMAYGIKYSLAAQSGNKLTTSLALPINDSANETPTISGIAGYLG